MTQTDVTPIDTKRRRRSLAATAATTAGTLGLLAAGFVVATAPDRQEAVADRGAEVMPFDLDATTHQFVPTDDGGRQTVVADDPEDETQVDLVRTHLEEEAEAFARGDFSDPAAIHGSDMPGLATLEATADSIAVDYQTQDGGAEISYTASDPAVVAALHEWFEAQTSDHGDHAS